MRAVTARHLIPRLPLMRPLFRCGFPRPVILQRRAIHRTPRTLSEHGVQVRGDVPPPYTSKRTSYFNPTMIALGVIPILSFALGVWQVKRLKWKVNLIDELTEKLQREPIFLPSKVK
jgi:surfeit locus 1 family protein